MRKMPPTIANFEDVRRGLQTKECGKLLAAENHTSPKASKKTGTSDLPCMELNSVNNPNDQKHIFPRASRSQPCRHLAVHKQNQLNHTVPGRQTHGNCKI